jgi:hypothetical protein
VSEEDDPILLAIRTGGTSKLRTPSFSELAQGEIPEAASPSLSERNADVGAGLKLPPPANPPTIDTTRIPRNPFTNKLELEPPILTEEEKQRAGTIRPPGKMTVPGPHGIPIQVPEDTGAGVMRMLGAGAPEGSEMANLTGQRGVRNPDEMRLLAPEQLMTESEQQQHPFLTGAGEFAGGMTTPESLALILGTAGAGELAGPAAQTARRLLAAGFTAQMLQGAIQQVPEVADAIRRGDTYNAKRLLAKMALTAGMAGLAAHGTFEESKPLFLPKGEMPGIPTEPIGAGEQLQPETLETLQAQVDALKNGTNRAVYFPRGQGTIPEAPDNATVTIVKGNKPGAGTWYHDDSITPQQIRAAVKNGTYSQLLGFTQPKEEAVANGKPTTVVARDASGVELKAGLVDATNPQAIAEQAAELAHQFPEAQIGTETPESVVSERQAPTTEQSTSAPAKALSGQTKAVKKPQFAYRVRDVGEEGVTSNPNSHAHATTSLEEAQSYVEHRGNIQGKPQEIVKVNLSKLSPEDYTIMPREGQAPWVKFNRPLDESEVQVIEPEEKVQEVHIPGVTAAPRKGARDDAAAESRDASVAEAPESRSGVRSAAGETGEAVEPEVAQVSETAETPETPEVYRLTQERTRQARPVEEQNALPGMENAVEEQRQAAAREQGRQLAEEANHPGASIEEQAGRMERESPLFRGHGPQGELYSGVHPKALIEGARVLQRAWEEKIAKPFIDRVLKIGDKYRKARAADPAVAEGLHLLDNAPQYLRAKAAQTVQNVIGKLSRAQERLFVLMADADSRENLRMNHPEEYAQAQNDQAIQEALRKYRPLEQELTKLRLRMGGQALPQDYLRRVYDKYVAGVNKPEAAGTSERGTSAFDRVIRPQRIGNLSREATAEYHYEHGLHEFGPAFATKFIGTHLRALRDSVAREFLSKATMLPTGAPEPRFIEYGVQRYYRPDVARDMREAGQKNVQEYGVYDPTAGEKFPAPSDGKYLGPRDLVNALTDFGRREEGEPGALRRFFQEQILGFGFGIPHVANIMRRVSQTVPLGAVNPEGWARAWKVVLSKELRSRGIAGLDDPTFDMLAKHGAIPSTEWGNLKAYWGGNLNPANWARALAQVGHKFLFEPTAAKGFGGLDQRARLYVADLVRRERPELTDAQIAEAVRTQLGDYNRANWTDQQKMLSKFMMFPGWDFSSVKWVVQHPIKTTVPPALMVLLANRVLHQFGQNREEDQYDVSNIHVGDRSYGTSLLRESVARNLFRPAIAFAQSKLRGESDQRAFDAAARGVTAGAGGLLSMLRPDLSGFLALATNREGLFSSKEIVSRKDWGTPGKVLPSKALEKQAVFTLRHAVPALDRMLNSGEDVDLKSFVGGSLGVPNFQYGAEQRLSRNTAEANRTYQTISRLAKTDPGKAREMLKDPDNAAFALFHHDLNSMMTALHKVDQVREAVDSSKIPDTEKQQRLKALDNFRQALLAHADSLGDLLFRRRMAGKKVPILPALRVGAKIPLRPANAGAVQ